MDRDRYSAAVLRVADSFGEPITASQLATALLPLTRSGAELITQPLDEPGVDRSVDDWLERCAQILKPPRQLDSGRVLLALGRLDERVGAVLRRSGMQERLRPDGALEPWATRTVVRGYRRVARIEDRRARGVVGEALITAGGPSIERWTLAGEPSESFATPRGDVLDGGVLADGTILALLETGDVVEIPSGRIVAHHDEAVQLAVGGGRFATIQRAGETFVGDAVGGPSFGVYLGGLGAALSPDEEELAWPTAAMTVARRAIGADAIDASDAGGAPERCVYSPDGSRLAVLLTGGRVAVRDLRGERWDVFPGPADACTFTADGTLLITSGLNGIQAIDVVAGVLRGEPTGGLGGAERLLPGPGGLVAEVDRSGTTLWEPITSTSMLAAVTPDSTDGVDRLDITADANALADVIAAKSTQPPLSIGLFADWGSGKSFLIRKIQERVRVLSAADTPTHHRHVRNVEFNAWHFADANLWASLASHILETLARSETGAPDRTAAEQLSRLEERLAEESATGRQLERARRKAQEADARRRIALLALGRDRVQTVSDLKDAWTWVRVALGVLMPLLLLAGLLVALFGFDAVYAVAGAAVAFVPTFFAAAKQVLAVLKRAGDAEPVESVKQANADVAASRAREAELRQEYEDLAHGRALARYVADRDAAGDYRAQLGLISRIHDDFERMSRLLDAAPQTAAGEPGELPEIDRIVLYIDDLDRCSPSRVVEVLEAVHLILALRLFVVVIAVDPRWLLQSLRLHYAEMLSAEEEPEWESTPLNYLEKIIQIPFTLRPMDADGTASLVGSLLPVYESAPTQDRPPQQVSVLEAVAALPGPGGAPAPAPAIAFPAAPAPAPPRFNPRALVLTEGERDFAAFVATELRTPRAVKKLTNVYRLVRARLDEESDAFYAFLNGSETDIPDYQAVLILLTVIIAYPDRAAELLRACDRSRGAWSPRQVGGELGAFLNRATEHAANGSTTSTEPFGRWARELARYSFEAGQEVFAKR